MATVSYQDCARWTALYLTVRVQITLSYILIDFETFPFKFCISVRNFVPLLQTDYKV